MSYLNIGPHTIHHGDSRDVLATLPDNSISACVCDPPYALVSIVKRFGQPGAAPAKGNDAYARASAGFMGQSWDTGEVAFATEFWAQVLRVLKPGGHVVAFSGTRTYHRLAVAIEDSGFEIRDQLAWVYGSGFPKSHDVSKAIDKMDAITARTDRRYRFTEWFVGVCKLSAREMDAVCGTNTMGRHWTDIRPNGKQPDVPTRRYFEMLRPHINGGVPQWVEDAINERTVESENFKNREVVSTQEMRDTSNVRIAVAADAGGYNPSATRNVQITTALTPQAQQWEGWGTALKPAWEPIVLARKPLIGTVAANVLEHGTGAINIDGCRVGDEGGTKKINVEPERETISAYGKGLNGGTVEIVPGLGRFPANILHDGEQFGENGRYFYSPKASKKDRGEGNIHPTVKPTDLMAYLCRLVTPPGGVVLDPFMGSGSTGKGAHAEGFRFIGIEREENFFEIAAARLMDLT